MKTNKYFRMLVIFYGTSLLLNGCLFKPTAAPTRTFILSPMQQAPSTSVGTPQLSIEVGLVKMPSYLVRDSMLIRNGSDEIKYLNDALWADRLDQLFRQTLADNLSSLLSATPPGNATAQAPRTVVRVSVDINRFDVDSEGRGNLRGRWRVNVVGNNKLSKTDEAHLSVAGPSPRDNPQAIANTLSRLTADFSRDLARVITELTAHPQ